ncbi:uncharacterized protein RCC_09273 [Ramularia collo-cygni]|uniref:Asl1-like glycosyl hydrolase catalytic domain-containing protein n=1 Tax=Ramularia collo-cygni TaxID=112498 RepID=A0A2D3VJR2_9PEZI|nr:uncharacterized protein RCC_09273 [Ramularia collo-cygni]CZT23559.1 uncharacterized protein RCC_09273 [Ramularia collo-cygni]
MRPPITSLLVVIASLLHMTTSLTTQSKSSALRQTVTRKTSRSATLVSSTTKSTRSRRPTRSTSTFRSSTSLSSSKATPTITTSTTSIGQSSTSSSRLSSGSSSPQQSAVTVKNTGKRGLPYNNDTLTGSFSLDGQESHVSWGYNWFHTRRPTAPDYETNKALTFVPTLFNDEPNLMVEWPSKAQAAIDDGADAIFSFNEPDSCWDGSACMTINQSVTAYKSAIMPFAGKARLGAPAVTDQGGSGGLQYLEDFIGNCTGCPIDFINLHWYNNMYAYEYFKTYMTAAHNRFPNYPIYITEFGDNSNTGDAQTQIFLQQVMPWMDAVPWIERYSWFGNFPGYLINANGSGLSDQGSIYNSYTKPCANPSGTVGMC